VKIEFFFFHIVQKGADGVDVNEGCFSAKRFPRRGAQAPKSFPPSTANGTPSPATSPLRLSSRLQHGITWDWLRLQVGDGSHYHNCGGHGHDDGGADPSRLHDLLPLLRQVTTTRISLFQPMLKKKEIFSRIFSACGIVPRQYKFLLQLKQEICYCFYCFYFLGNASTIVSEAVKWGTRKGRILAP